MDEYKIYATSNWGKQFYAILRPVLWLNNFQNMPIAIDKNTGRAMNVLNISPSDSTVR